MGEARIPDKVLDALVENTRVIDSNTQAISQIQEAEVDEKENNIVKNKKVKPILTPLEKRRYANIGKEMMTPFLKSLKELIATEKKKSEMIVDKKTETVEKEAKKQYKAPKGGKGGDIMELIRLLTPIIIGVGIAVYTFKNKIIKFFEDIWDWIKDFFKPVMTFFDFSSPESPVVKIWDTISSNITNAWESISGFFDSLSDFPQKIWDKAVEGWNIFLDKMTKWWDAATIIWDKMVSKLDNFYNTAKDTIKEVISSIFKKYEGVWTTVSSWFSDEDEKEEKEKAPEKKKTEEGVKIDPEKVQAKQNIEILADSLKSSIASDVVNKMSEQMDISSLSEEERARYESLLQRNVKVDKGEISVDLEEVRKQIREEMKRGGANSEFTSRLENLNEEDAAALNNNINSDLNKDQGMIAVHKTILDSATLIKEAFGDYNKQIRENFVAAWESFLHNYIKPVTYTIAPVHKESFEQMTNELARIAQESTEMIKQQNGVLEKIKEILSIPPAPPPAPIIISPNGSGQTYPNPTSVTGGAKYLMGRLAMASSHWH